MRPQAPLRLAPAPLQLLQQGIARAGPHLINHGSNPWVGPTGAQLAQLRNQMGIEQVHQSSCSRMGLPFSAQIRGSRRLGFRISGSSTSTASGHEPHVPLAEACNRLASFASDAAALLGSWEGHPAERLTPQAPIDFEVAVQRENLGDVQPLRECHQGEIGEITR